jgi:hypothetical protein
MCHAQMTGRGQLKPVYLLSKDELLRLQHMAKCPKQFLLERLVLPFQVEHGYGQSFSGGLRRDGWVLHPNILAAWVDRRPLCQELKGAVDLFDETESEKDEQAAIMFSHCGD